MSNPIYSDYDDFIEMIQDLLPCLLKILQNRFNQEIANETYGTPTAPKDGTLLKYTMGEGDEEQTISPLSILIECVSSLYKAMHNLGPFASQIELGKGIHHLIGYEAMPGPTPELNAITNHHLKVLSDLFKWALNKCKAYSAAKEYELCGATYGLHWDQIGSHAYDFLTKWEAHVTLKHALPSDKNALFNSVFILHEKLNGKDQTAESVADILSQCYELTTESAPVHLSPIAEVSELTALQAATLINCWACGDLGHVANRCPDAEAHVQWKQERIKVTPKGCANACIMLPMEGNWED
ncbi:uncharacterized protein UHO2_05835 [Ustilago hordei]|uniref:CCHC-type domain-containing protein n=1 Tax=Ustilago hordei TaxID=120017 RepID=I2FS68_USTHO|nr:uncharacterized protein UHO2_05835 [Ustilago hordei]CCF49761.1 uncharacterized protein UHOR_13884 [Ustilago hordei]SYW84882.1 uncharacterized protein UHO2_05835 [Ustilago hordei]